MDITERISRTLHEMANKLPYHDNPADMLEQANQEIRGLRGRAKEMRSAIDAIEVLLMGADMQYRADLWKGAHPMLAEHEKLTDALCNKIEVIATIEALRGQAEHAARAATMLQEARTREYRARGDVDAHYASVTPRETLEWRAADLLQNFLDEMKD